MSTKVTGRCDYLKFMFRTEHDRFQANHLSTYHSILVTIGVSPDNRAVTELTALGQGRDGRNRYIIEIWGEAADEFLMHIPDPWLQVLRRVDLRTELMDLTTEQMEAATNYLDQVKAKHNTQKFKTRPRQKKGEKRDIGGTGLYHGSRKSRQHSVLYKRGKERPASEYRVRDDEAEKRGREAAAMVNSGEARNAYDALMTVMGERAALWYDDIYGPEWQKAIVNAVHQGTKLREMALELGIFDELPEEREYWENLAVDEQVAEQKETWEPTAKALRDKRAYCATCGDEIGPRHPGCDVMEGYDDDLPF